MTPKKCEEFQNTEKVRRASEKVGETPEKWVGAPIFFGDPFDNGVGVCSVVFESRYVVKEIKAVDATVEIYLQLVEEDMDWVKEQAGVEPNLFDGA